MNNTYNPQANSVYERNLNIVKNYFKNTKILILPIMLLASAVAQIVISIILSSSLSPVLNPILNSANVNFNINGGSFAFTGINIFGILTIVAFFLIYFQSKNQNINSTPKTGFTILYVISIINIVCTCIAFVFAMFLSVVLFFLPEASQKNGGLTINATHIVMTSEEAAIFHAAMIAIIIFVILIFVVAVIFAAAQLNFYKSISSTLKNPIIPFVKGAGVFGVFSAISAAFCIIGLTSSICMTFSQSSVFSSLTTFLSKYNISVNDFSALAGVSSISSIVMVAISAFIYILYASMALGYKKYLASATASMK